MTLGNISYYRKFIKGYVQITGPMDKLLKKYVTFKWDEECQKSLDILKEKMVTTSILIFPEWNKEFHVHVDASCIMLGIVLAQPGAGEVDHPIAFASRKLSKVEKNYTTIEREALAMVYELEEQPKKRHEKRPDEASKVELRMSPRKKTEKEQRTKTKQDKKPKEKVKKQV